MDYVMPHHRDFARPRTPLIQPFKVVVLTIFVGLFVFATIVTCVALIQPQGLRLFAVPEASMGQGLPTGSVAVVLPAATYQAGDIVAFHSSDTDEVRLHRVVGWPRTVPARQRIKHKVTRIQRSTGTGPASLRLLVG